MGTRIRKAIGYALTDLEENDPRINWASPLLDFELFDGTSPDGEPMTFDGLADYIARNNPGSPIPGLLRVEAKIRPYTPLNDCVIHDTEGGDPAVLVVVPPSYLGSWTHSDDDIDYIEAHFGEGPDTDPVVTPVPGGFYPFNGVFMDRQTGLDLIAGRTMGFRHGIRDGVSPEELDGLARNIRLDGDPVDTPGPFTNAAEAVDRITPRLPEEVKHLASFGALFTDPLGWSGLRPVHYKWWS
ncbi:hypothetical protein [Arthrobacter sp. A2-55]|uniref:hypothetical protein n=1 Tax=Arthrobacter sp. A2-55 TaxID=2897337 RepID=UPI0021CDA59E|nr:hypothetical protein [Arthrobacter sp. A2-55]MCU6481292.1 hypothetical protein [Arthrobacter sp. A2-55]